MLCRASLCPGSLRRGVVKFLSRVLAYILLLGAPKFEKRSLFFFRCRYLRVFLLLDSHLCRYLRGFVTGRVLGSYAFVVIYVCLCGARSSHPGFGGLLTAIFVDKKRGAGGFGCCGKPFLSIKNVGPELSGAVESEFCRARSCLSGFGCLWKVE